MEDKEKRLKQIKFWTTASKASVFVFVMSAILFFLTLVFENIFLSTFLLTMCLVGVFFSEQNRRMLSPARKIYEELAEESVLMRTKDLEIFICNYVFRDRFSIRVSIPKMGGAKIIYTNHKTQMCDVFKSVLEDRKISVHEFYVRYIEDDVLEFLNEKLKKENETANKRNEKLISEVNKFIDNKNKQWG